MPIEISMPKLSDTMTEGTLVKWLKKEGDAIKPGDIIAEVETDKATQELEVFEAGTLAKIVVPEGGKTPVGGLIVVIAKPGEDFKQVAAGVKSEGGAAGGGGEAGGEAGGAGEGGEKKRDVGTKPMVTQVAVSAGGAPMLSQETKETPEAPVIDYDEGTEQPTPAGKIRVSPLARKIAAEQGVDLNTIRGTGPDGRIIKRDVLEAAGKVQRTAPPAAAATPPRVPAPAPTPRAPAPVGAGGGLKAQTIPLSNMRQTIARRLLESKQTIPHFYCTIDVQMDALLELRQTINSQLAPEKISVTDLIARATTVALTRVPQINASFATTAIVQHGTVELGIAVALEGEGGAGGGLVVPVVRGAQAKSLRQLSQEIKQLAELARSKRLKPQDMTGSTFTITNLGMYGIKDFYAIINPPEAGILAVGATQWRPIVNTQKQVVPAQVMTLTLAADHRVVDGAAGAQFLSELKNILESPMVMLI